MTVPHDYHLVCRRCAMTRHVSVRIACDAPQCAATHDGNRLEARHLGWSRDYEDDLCPQHSNDPRHQLVAEIRQMATRGMRDGWIAERFGISRDTVMNLRKAHNIPGQRPGRPRSAA